MIIFHLVHWKNSGIYVAVESLKKEGASHGDTHRIEVLRKEKGLFDALKGTAVFLKFVFLCLFYKHDAINLHSFAPHLVNILYKGNHCYSFFHSNYPYLNSSRRKDKSKRTITQFLLKRRKIVAVSNVVRKSLLESLGLDSTVCFNLINLSSPKNSTCEVRTFGSAGRFDPEKNFDALVNYFSTRKTKEEIFLAGKGSQLEKLRHFAEERKLDHIHFLGHQSSMERFFDRIDVYICCSKYEGFGLAIAEAMIAGKILISTKVGILCEDAPFKFIELNTDLSNIDTAISRAIELNQENINTWTTTNITILREKFSNQATYQMYTKIQKGGF